MLSMRIPYEFLAAAVVVVCRILLPYGIAVFVVAAAAAVVDVATV